VVGITDLHDDALPFQQRGGKKDNKHPNESYDALPQHKQVICWYYFLGLNQEVKNAGTNKQDTHIIICHPRCEG
jgi:hypothetical protein